MQISRRLRDFEVRIARSSTFSALRVKEVERETTSEECSICLRGFEESGFWRCESCELRFHEACSRIWLEERSLTCPSCRWPWPLEAKNLEVKEDKDNNNNKEQTLKSSSSTWDVLECGGLANELPLPVSTLRQKHWQLASNWTSVLGRDLVACLLSKDWLVRETAVKRLSRDVANALRQEAPTKQNEERLWRCAADVLTYAVDDKVYKVCLAAARCLRTLLVFSRPEAVSSYAKSALRPIVQVLLAKCADGNRRVAELAAETLLELSRGENGLLGLGRYAAGDQAPKGDLGLDFVLQVIFEERRDPNSPVINAILGRFITLDALIRDLPDEFSISSHYQRVMATVEFTFQHLGSGHVTIGKIARELFIAGARLTLSEPRAFAQVWNAVSSLEPPLQLRMRRKLKAEIEEQANSEDLETYMMDDKLRTTTSDFRLPSSRSSPTRRTKFRLEPSRRSRSRPNCLNLTSKPPRSSSSQRPSTATPDSCFSSMDSYLNSFDNHHQQQESVEDPVVSLALEVSRSFHFETPLPFVPGLTNPQTSRTQDVRDPLSNFFPYYTTQCLFFRRRKVTAKADNG